MEMFGLDNEVHGNVWFR